MSVLLEITYVLTPRCRVLLEKLTGLQLVKKFPRISRNPKVHYRTHKRPLPVSILGQPNPVHIPTSHLLEIRPNIIHTSTPRSPHWSPFLRFPQQDPIHPPLFTHTRHMPSPSHYRTHKRPPPVSILGQPNPVHIPTSHLLEIRPNIIHPSTTRSPQWSPSSGFPSKTLYTPSSPIRATCPAHLILLDFITRTILGEEYKSFSSWRLDALKQCVSVTGT